MMAYDYWSRELREDMKRRRKADRDARWDRFGEIANRAGLVCLLTVGALIATMAIGALLYLTRVVWSLALGAV